MPARFLQTPDVAVEHVLLVVVYGLDYLVAEPTKANQVRDLVLRLPLFRQRKAGCWNWGLVAGRTQTYFPWGSPKDAPEPKQWQYDIFRKDGTPFDAAEIAVIKRLTGRPSAALQPAPIP